jgi:hypothetical protein
LKSLSTVFPAFFLLVQGGLCCLVAWLFAADAVSWLATLDIRLESPMGLIELKAMYIGLMAGAGVYFIFAAFSGSLRYSAILFAVLSNAGLVAVRGWEVFNEQNSNEILLQLLMLESVLLLAAVFALFCQHRRNARKRNPYF